MIGERYWASGISLEWSPLNGQKADISFFDAGFFQDESTEGKLYTRYYINDPVQATKILIEDATKLGIQFRPAMGDKICLYVNGDGESEDYPLPSNWKQILTDVAMATGCISVYDQLIQLQEESNNGN